MNTYLCLTFDYELFLGRNLGTANDILFAPTQRLLELLQRLRAPATFFADVCSIGSHERVGHVEYTRAFKRQLQDAASMGHDVQLHLHPHWEYATFHKDQWSPTPGKMSLSDFLNDPVRPLDKILRNGVDYLTQLVQPILRSYRCVAFRGPGLALQPREDAVLGALINAGIKLDSTVAKDYRFTSDFLTIDYRRCPSEPNWRMMPATGIRRPSRNGGIWEVPIVSFIPRPGERARFLMRRATRAKQIRGFSLATTASDSRVVNMARLVASNLRYFSPTTRLLLSTDSKGLTASMLVEGLKDYVDQHSQHGTVCASMIGHPKLMFAEQLAILREFIQRTRDELGAQYITLSKALTILKGQG